MSLISLVSSQALIRAVSSQEPPKKLAKPVSIALGILAVSAVVVYRSPGLRAVLREGVWEPVVNRCIDAWALFFLRVDEGDRFRQMGPGVLDGVNGWERARVIHLAAEEGWSRAELRALIGVRQDLRQRVEEAIRDLDPQETRASLIRAFGHYRYESASFEIWETLSAENKRDVMAAFTVLRQGNQGVNDVRGDELVELMETPFGQRRKIAELVATLYRSNSVHACRGFMRELAELDSDQDRAILTSAVEKLKGGNDAYLSYEIPVSLARWLKRYSFSDIQSLTDELEKLVKSPAPVKNLEILANQILRMKNLHGDEGLALLRSILGHREGSFPEHFDDLLRKVAKISDEELLDTLTALQLLSKEESHLGVKKNLLAQLLKDAPAGQRTEVARAIEIWSASLVDLKKRWLIRVARNIPEGRRLEVAEAILPLLEQFKPVRFLGNYGSDTANTMIDHLSQLYLKTGQESLTLIKPLLIEQDGQKQAVFVRKVHQCLPSGDEGIEFFKGIQALMIDSGSYSKFVDFLRLIMPVASTKELLEELKMLFEGLESEDKRELINTFLKLSSRKLRLSGGAPLIRPTFTIKQRLSIVLGFEFNSSSQLKALQQATAHLEDAEAYSFLCEKLENS